MGAQDHLGFPGLHVVDRQQGRPHRAVPPRPAHWWFGGYAAPPTRFAVSNADWHPTAVIITGGSRARDQAATLQSAGHQHVTDRPPLALRRCGGEVGDTSHSARPTSGSTSATARWMSPCPPTPRPPRSARPDVACHGTARPSRRTTSRLPVRNTVKAEPRRSRPLMRAVTVWPSSIWWSGGTTFVHVQQSFRRSRSVVHAAAARSCLSGAEFVRTRRATETAMRAAAFAISCAALGAYLVLTGQPARCPSGAATGRG